MIPVTDVGTFPRCRSGHVTTLTRGYSTNLLVRFVSLRFTACYESLILGTWAQPCLIIMTLLRDSPDMCSGYNVPCFSVTSAFSGAENLGLIPRVFISICRRVEVCGGQRR